MFTILIPSDWSFLERRFNIFSPDSLQILGAALYDPESDVSVTQRDALVREAHLWIAQHEDDHGFG